MSTRAVIVVESSGLNISRLCVHSTYDGHLAGTGLWLYRTFIEHPAQLGDPWFTPYQIVNIIMHTFMGDVNIRQPPHIDESKGVATNVGCCDFVYRLVTAEDSHAVALYVSEPQTYGDHRRFRNLDATLINADVRRVNHYLRCQAIQELREAVLPII